MKRIIICSDGTWNRPERLNSKNFPTNVLRLARQVAPVDEAGTKQIVFYDWGLGSYHSSARAGSLGIGLEKNIMDGYRFLAHNYEIGDEIFLFGFSRGAYTIRSLCGLINNCGILRSEYGSQIEYAFKLYKTKRYKPRSNKAVQFRKDYAIEPRTEISFIGAWDTVGAMGLPYTLFANITDSDLFFDRKIGGNTKVVRHALALDELRADFEPTIWDHRADVDIKQVWFCGCHSDIGGSYGPDKNGELISDISYKWIIQEAQKCGMKADTNLTSISASPYSTLHNEYKGKYKLLGKLIRNIPANNASAVKIHESVAERLEYNPNYSSPTIERYVQKFGKLPEID